MNHYRTEGNCRCECGCHIAPGQNVLTDGKNLFCNRECWDRAHDCDRFQLVRESRHGKVTVTYQNNPAKPVKSLFPGSHSCLPGQSDLFD